MLLGFTQRVSALRTWSSLVLASGVLLHSAGPAKRKNLPLH
jgi:hypothetical protein